MKFNCGSCGKIDEAVFDGYLFGDRLLEGVKFAARKNDDGSCEVRLMEPGTLAVPDEKHWMSLAKKFAEQNDVLECPACYGQAVPDDMLA